MTLALAEKKNALTLAMYADMAHALSEADQSDAIHCGVIAGVPGAFCAGNDITDFLKASSGGLDPRAHEFLHALARRQKPLVAAVDGVAIGVGTTMLFHCDHVVAGSGATLSTPFLKLGLIPGAGGTQRLPRLVGRGQALDIMLTGRQVAADEAHRIGLISRLVPARQAGPEALSLAAELGRASRIAQQAVIRTVDASYETALPDGLAYEAEQVQTLFGHEEAKEGITAFLEKRPPNFS